MLDNELEYLVSEVKNGKRALLFPPGVLLFAFSIVASIVSTVFFSAALIQMLVSDLPVEKRALLQFLSMGALFGGCIFPGIMIVRGKRVFSFWLRSYYLLLGSAIVSVIALGLITGSTWQVPPLIIALFFSGFSILASLLKRFKQFCEFFYLLKM